VHSSAPAAGQDIDRYYIIKSHKMVKILVYILVTLSLSGTARHNCRNRLPVIDMHIHANSVSNISPRSDPPLELPYNDPADNWYSTYIKWYSNPKYINPATSDKELMDQTLEILEKNNIYAMVCGNYTDDYILEGGNRIIPGLAFGMSDGRTPEQIRELLSGGKYRVFGEIVVMYEGIMPGDTAFEPYLEVAEELDIPVMIHIGPGPPGAPYMIEKYRASLHNPLLIEEALVRHPRLRVCIAHAGWPMTDEMLAILWNYPQVYVDLGLICYAIPRAEFYTYLKRLVDAGFGKRVMYGSDQMSWPNSTLAGIAAVEKAVFLSKEQKRDILYNNAARFLRLSEEEIADQHSKR
jgi:hypothetical protein